MSTLITPTACFAQKNVVPWGGELSHATGSG